MNKGVVLLFLGSLLTVAGCRKHDSGSSSNTMPPSQQVPLIAGDYSGSFVSTLVPNGDLHVTIDQNGVDLTGTFVGHSGGFSGSLTGIVGMQTFTMTLTQTSPCNGSFSVIGAMNDPNLSGNFSGSDCGGNNDGRFTVNRR